MGQQLEAAVFDVDGMLLDTREFIFQAYEHSLTTHGHPIPPRETMAEYIGLPIRECYLAFAPDGDFDQLFEAHDLFQAEKLHLIVAYNGLHEMLSTLKDANLKIGAFSSRFKNLIPSLEHVDALKYFDAIVQGDEVEAGHHKPHPEGLLKVLDRLSVSPSKSVMSGDAAVDIRTGKAAGVALTIGITHGFGTKQELVQAQPDYIVDKLLEIPPLLLPKTF